MAKMKNAGNTKGVQGRGAMGTHAAVVGVETGLTTWEKGLGAYKHTFYMSQPFHACLPQRNENTSTKRPVRECSQQLHSP